jgi:MFS family permease
MGGVMFVVKDQMHLSTPQVGLVMGSLQFVSIFGLFIAGYVSDTYGRTRALLLAATLFFLGGVVLMCSAGFYSLLAGRFIKGLALGIGVSVDPLYISEISPKENRGALVTLSEIAISSGMTLGYFAAWVFSGIDPQYSWRLMLSLGALLPIVMVVLVLTIMEETPRFLMKVFASTNMIVLIFDTPKN